jgi:hypothetical protein
MISSMNNTTTATFINAQDLRASEEVREQNEKSRFNANATETCFLCSKKMSPKAKDNAWHVHLTTNYELASVDMGDVLESNDQGWFPVGSECAKRVPLTHRMKFSD